MALVIFFAAAGIEVLVLGGTCICVVVLAAGIVFEMVIVVVALCSPSELGA